MGLKPQRLRVDGQTQPDTSDIFTSAATVARSGRTLSIAGTGGGLDGAVAWARLQNATVAGATQLQIDRAPGLLSILPECRLLIGVGSSQHEYKSIIPSSVNGSVITVSPMDYAHQPNDIVLIMAPNAGIIASYIGMKPVSVAGAATQNTAILDRFCRVGGLASLAGGAAMVYDGLFALNDMVKVQGSKISMRGMSPLSSAQQGLTADGTFVFPSNLTKTMISIQDDAGNAPTLANLVGNGAPMAFESMAFTGNRGVDAVGLVNICDGGYMDSMRVRYWGGPGSICLGGKNVSLVNMQPDFSDYGFLMFGDGWIIRNLCGQSMDWATPAERSGGNWGRYTFYPTAFIRITGGTGGTIVGGDYESCQTPGLHVALEGTATGLHIEGCWMNGLTDYASIPNNDPVNFPAYFGDPHYGDPHGQGGTFINIDSTGGPGDGGAASYRIDSMHTYDVSTTNPWKMIRDVQRNVAIWIFNLVQQNREVYGRTLRARTVSPTQIAWDANFWNGGPNQIASSGTPHPAGTFNT